MALLSEADLVRVNLSGMLLLLCRYSDDHVWTHEDLVPHLIPFVVLTSRIAICPQSALNANVVAMLDRTICVPRTIRDR